MTQELFYLFIALFLGAFLITIVYRKAYGNFIKDKRKRLAMNEENDKVVTASKKLTENNRINRRTNILGLISSFF